MLMVDEIDERAASRGRKTMTSTFQPKRPFQKERAVKKKRGSATTNRHGGRARELRPSSPNPSRCEELAVIANFLTHLLLHV
jgi:hypothetical protein